MEHSPSSEDVCGASTALGMRKVEVHTKECRTVHESNFSRRVGRAI
jgi:hypothetical protein